MFNQYMKYMKHMKYVKYMENKQKYLNLTYLNIGGAKKRKRKSLKTITDTLGDNVITIDEIDKKYQPIVSDMFARQKGVERHKLKVNKVGIYSMTQFNDALELTKIISEYIDPSDAVMINATSGIGGEIINMHQDFKFIYGYEISPEQFEILKHNCEIYNTQNVELINDDYTANINKQQADVVIIDPPWGGLDYKNHPNLDLKLGNMSMSELANAIDAKIIVLKLPFNHDLTKFGNYDVHKLKKFLIVVIKKF